MDWDAFFGGGVLFVIAYAIWTLTSTLIFQGRDPNMPLWMWGGIYTSTYMLTLGIRHLDDGVVPVDEGVSYIVGIWAAIALLYMTRARTRLRGQDQAGQS